MTSHGKPVNTVYLIDSLERGGAQRQLVELVKGVDKSVINPHVVVYHDIMDFKEDLDRAGIPVWCLHKREKTGLFFLLKFLFFLSRHKISLIHSFLNIPNFYARMAKVVFPSISVVTSERNVSITHSKVHTTLERKTWWLSDKIIVNAGKIKEILVDEVAVAPQRISVINNGIDLETFSTTNETLVKTIRDKLLPEKESLLIGLVGRMCEQKGQCYAVEAAKHLQSCHPELNFRICFWGSEDDSVYVEALKRTIVKENLTEKVVLAGVHNDIPSVMQASDLLILPSLWEGFPNVLLEAMVSRTPVIATAIVDNKQIVDDGRTGFLVEPGNPVALADKIIAFSRMSSAAVQEMTRMAHDSIASRFSKEIMVQNTLKVYEDADSLAAAGDE
jgi:glycosyltransferase involved in cell wall biosynthesis